MLDISKKWENFDLDTYIAGMGAKMQETKLPEAQDLMELVRKSIDEGVSIGGYVMRWSFLDQSLCPTVRNLHPILQSIEDELEDTPFHLDFRYQRWRSNDSTI